MLAFLSQLINLLISPVLHPLYLIALSRVISRVISTRKLAARSSTILQAKTIPKILTATAIALPVLYSFLPIGELLLQPLENAYPLPSSEEIQSADGIIVLVGFVDSSALSVERSAQFNGNIERFLSSVAIHRQYPDKRLVFTGYGPSLNAPYSEGEGVRYLIDQLGINAVDSTGSANIIFEEQSTNTYENALFTYDLLQPSENERWLILSSAWHVPRSMLTFKKVGWQNITAYPVDYRTRPQALSIVFRPIDSFSRINTALHEYVGIISYWITGRL